MIGAIIQARMGSTRMPGKVLMDVGGQPMLGRVIGRVRRVRGIDTVVVATSAAPADRAVVDHCAAVGIPCYAGSEDDVLDRYYQAATRYGLSAVVRITADCPLLDPEVVTQVVALLGSVCDYAANVHPPTFPDGLDAEAFTMSTLATAWREATLPSEREHVTPYMWKQPGRFRTRNLTAPADYSHLRWTVDDAFDLAYIREVYRRLGDPTGWQAIVDHLAHAPELAALNAGTLRNEGYQRSLSTDPQSSPMSA